MSFQDRNSSGSPSTGGENASGRSAPSRSGGFLGNLWSNAAGAFEDSGLSDKAPERATVLAILCGMLLGMFAAYVVMPTEFRASPRHLSQGAIDQWVRMVAVGHSQEVYYDEANALITLEKIPNPQAVVSRLARSANINVGERTAIAELQNIPGFSEMTGAEAPADPGLILSSLQIILALLLVAIAVPAVVIAWRSVAQGNAGSSANSAKARRAARRSSGAVGQVSPRAQASPQASSPQDSTLQWPEDETEKSGVLHPQFGVPVLQTVSSYVKGQSYNESFNIELGPKQGKQFLGECGISTASKVGEDLQAIEFWGFDMASQETRTMVLAAPAAISDPSLIAAVGNRVKNPSTDIVAATAGATLVIDSYSVQLQAEVKNVICNYGGGAPNSGIESLQLEILVWQKLDQQFSHPAASEPPATENPFIDYSNVGYASPEQMPSSISPPPAASPFEPPQSSSKPAPEDDEDDPFGGTGNFMPYS